MSWIRMGAARQAMEGAAKKALLQAGEYVLDESNRQAPIEEGTLIRSSRVDVDDDMAMISYDTPYAVYQHERTELAHTGGRKAKFLQDPMLQNRDKIREHLAKTIRREMK